MSDNSEIEDGPVPLPITGELDLHTFSPRDLPVLLPAYMEECRSRGILNVRIVHGKGTGTLRETVRSILRGLPGVLDYRNGDERSGSWGATLVILSAKKSPPS
ncbi:MAG: Smr/MutS family protein [Opitutaceae bacterium]|jgi:DNA-nicking Smr family endonuclease